MTRMWMINPKLMCRQHLLGEHKEIHQLLGSLIKKRKVTKYIENNCIEITSLVKRHDDLVNEMLFRGWKHKSLIVITQKEVNEISNYLPQEHINYIVNTELSYRDLLNRCINCRRILHENMRENWRII